VVAGKLEDVLDEPWVYQCLPQRRQAAPRRQEDAECVRVLGNRGE
jgi:hypothetical protein